MSNAVAALLPVINNMAASLRGLRNWAFQKGAHEKLHSFVVPDATYAPWLNDPQFTEIYRQIRTHTLVDVYRCYELHTLALQTAPLGGDFLEVGVWRGGTGCILANAMRLSGQEGLTLLADTFTGVVKAGKLDTYYKGGEHADTSLETVQGLLAAAGARNVKILVGIFPEQTGESFNSRPLSLCHIDVDTYESARDVFDWAWPRLVPGGVAVFDDYGFLGCEGVTKLVDEMDLGGTGLMLHNLNGHAVLVKR